MMRSVRLAAWAAGLVLAGVSLGSPALAQSVRLLGDHNAWSAYATSDDAGEICFVVSKPTATEPTPDGYGQAYLYLTHRPQEGVTNEFNLVAGYTFAPDSVATLTIGGDNYELFTQADAAWLDDPALTDTVAGRMRAGSSLTIEGTSERGIRVQQTFSLSGVTAASREIDAEC